jgi:hypothetical protein
MNGTLKMGRRGGLEDTGGGVEDNESKAYEEIGIRYNVRRHE